MVSLAGLAGLVASVASVASVDGLGWWSGGWLARVEKGNILGGNGRASKSRA